MNVQDILARKSSNTVRSIGPNRTVEEAVARLVEHNIGSLVVMEGGRPVGILTERDVLRCCADGMGKSASTPVSEIMTRDLIVGEPADEIDYVMGVMSKNRIRHLPVLDGGRLAGMVSIGDVVNVQLHETRYENRHLKDYIRGSY